MSADEARAVIAGEPRGRPAEQARLEVRDLEIRGGRRGPAVVSDVSFAVPPGDVLGLVGESGSGKTTVALALLGHTRRGLSVTGGEIRLDGTDLLRLRPAYMTATSATSSLTTAKSWLT